MTPRVWSFIIVILYSAAALGQDTTSIMRTSVTSGYVIGTALLTSGLITNKGSIKRGVRTWVRNQQGVPKTNIDDLLQHAPIVMLYISDLAEGVSKKDVGRHTRHLIVSEALSIGTSLILKAIVKNQRPNGGTHSFPSGHSAHAFAGAVVLYHSLKDHNKVLAYSGFIPAIITGSYRMIKDKHWLSDVLFGAGLGVLSSTLTYDLNIWKSRVSDVNDFSAKVNFGLTPNGVGLSVNF